MLQLNGFEELLLHFAKTIIANPNYEFHQEDKGRYVEGEKYRKEMRYELVMIEATRFADAFLKAKEELKKKI